MACIRDTAPVICRGFLFLRCVGPISRAMIDDYSAEARCKSDSGVGPESMECLGVNPKLLTFVAANLPCYAPRMALEAGQWLNGSNAHKRAERLFTSISQLRLI